MITMLSRRISLRVLALALTISRLTTIAYSQQYQWTHIAGKPGGAGRLDGPGLEARFSFPNTVRTDAAGNIYIWGGNEQSLRKISKAGVVTTVEFKDKDGLILTECHGLVVDANGNLYIANRQAHIIQKITPAGVVTTIAGKRNEQGTADGPSETARFFNPSDLVQDKAGNLYVVDGNNESLRRINPTGQVVTLAGQSTGLPSQVDGRGREARFASLRSIAMDEGGKIYALDKGVVRVVTSDGLVSTLAGQANGNGSRKDGTGAAASFSFDSTGIVMDGRGTIYVGDDSVIRAVTKEGVVSTFAGSLRGHADGIGKAAMFDTIRGLAIDASGHLIVADGGNHAIRKVSPEAVVTTIAGQPPNPGKADGVGEAARFQNPNGLAMDATGNLFVTDSSHTIRKVTPEGVVTTFAGDPQKYGYVDGPGGTANFLRPETLAIDRAGTLYVWDAGNALIRKITSSGVVSTLAGGPPTQGQKFIGNTDGTGPAASFSAITGMVVNGTGTVYLAAGQHDTIRQITSPGVVTTLAGLLNQPGNVDGAGNLARFRHPSGLAMDSSGAIYVADGANQAIRKISPAGVVTTAYRAPQNVIANFNGLAIDAAGNIYAACNTTVRKITPAGVMTTIGGTDTVHGGVDGLGAAAKFDNVVSIVVSPTGVLYVTDVGNNCIFRGVPVEPGGGKP